MMSARKPDFGFSWVWTYGHLVPLGGALAAGLAAIGLGAPGWVLAGLGGLAVWALAGLGVTRLLLRVNDPSNLPTPAFLPGGEGRVLDLGCGSGRATLMTALARPAARLVGLDDWSADYIADNGEGRTRANLHAAGVDDRVDLERGDMRKLPFGAAHFDAIVSSAAIDHLDRRDIPVALAEANRVLRPDGQFLLMVIVPNVWTFLAYGPFLYFHNVGRREWRRMLRDAGFCCDAEGSTRGIAWLLLRKEGHPAPDTLDEAPDGRAWLKSHVLWLAVALVVLGLGLQWTGVDTGFWWLAAFAFVAVHAGGAVALVSVLRSWATRRRQRRARAE